jgi:RimJ/RimL family protein N-acetyltransferase
VIEFLRFTGEDLPLFRTWLNKAHVRPHWQEPEDDEELRLKFLMKLPHRGVAAFTIRQDGISIGYIQYYEAAKVGSGWWPDELPGTFGVDLMIGEEKYLGRGLGSKIIREFIEFCKIREPSAAQFIIDPEPHNERAIRSFANAGFVRHSEIVTPNGRALLMRLNS